MKALTLNIVRLLILTALAAINFFSPMQAKDIVDDNKTTKYLVNEKELNPFLERLYQLEQSKEGKLNIVHIGDSHIQADFFTNVIRVALQEKFGNAGYGFTFPYRLVKTNGTRDFKYSSNAVWKSRLNVLPETEEFKIGLSGIGLYTDETNFYVDFSTEIWDFNSVKIIYPSEKLQYNVSIKDDPEIEIVRENVEDLETIIHKVKRGESLSGIAARYKISLKELKEENGFTSGDYIQAGWSIRIPPSQKSKRYKEKIIRKSEDYVDLEAHPNYSSFVSPEPLNKISFFPINNTRGHNINGLVFENGKSGLVYHSVGVNGAKASDFNKFPLFFEQLTILQPDLVILSFGTNESFQKLPSDQYIMQLREMISRIKSKNPDVVFLITTPAPSMLRRRKKNLLIKQYSKDLMEVTDIAVWDLYEKMGGEKDILAKGKYAGLIARDKVHYTQDGYRLQGEMFVEDFLEVYKQFKEKRKEN